MAHSRHVLYAIHENNCFSAQIEYTFNLVFSIYGIDWRVMSYKELAGAELTPVSVVISYGEEKPEGSFPHHIHIYESRLFGQDYLELPSMPEAPLKRFNDLPIIYQGSRQVEAHVRRTESLIETDIDIIASAFFMLTRYEEVIVDERDKFDRFPATASLAYKEGFLDRPIVNEYIELLWTWIDSFGLGFQRKNLWEGKDFAVCLTHDVDRIKKFRIIPPLFTLKRALLRNKSLGEAWMIFSDYIKTTLRMKDDPYQAAFEKVIDLEKERGVRSSFYFMAHGEDYSIKDSFIVDLIRRLKNGSFEIGLHGSLNSYNALGALRTEKKKVEEVLGEPVIGSRQHYLRWKTPITWRSLEKTGIKYDTTLGFADHEGFRCGICCPYRPFDILENRVLDIWEVPLIVMDESLFGYQNLSLERGWQVMKALIDTVERYRGAFVILWHNSGFYELEHPGRLDVYKGMLNYLGSKDALHNTILETLGTCLATAGERDCL